MSVSSSSLPLLRLLGHWPGAVSAVARRSTRLVSTLPLPATVNVVMSAAETKATEPTPAATAAEPAPEAAPVAPAAPEETKKEERSSSPTTDSSFDVSLEMDPDALEQALQQYD